MKIPSLLGLVIGGALTLAACGGSDSSSGTTSGGGDEGQTTTTRGAGSITIVGNESTTTSEISTTTVVTTTTIAATTVPPTTTEPRPDGLVLLADGFGPLAFGSTPEAAIEFLTAALGQPITDSGWTDAFSVYGTCPGAEVRGVEWPGLLMLFGDAADEYSPSGDRHFMQWALGWFGPDPFGLLTPERVGIGSGVDDVVEAFQDVVLNPADEILPASFQAETDRGTLWGTFDDAEAVQYITAGTACGE